MNKIIVFGIAGFCIWLMTAFPGIMVSPGELAEGHQDLRDSCTACHRPFWGLPNEKCISCHELSKIGLDTAGMDTTAVLFHSQLADVKCTACHTDHWGAKPAASISRGFTHDFLPVSQRDRCNSCHAKPDDDLHSKLSTECAKCHQVNDWKLSSPFNHDLLPASDKNNCVSCHQTPADAYHQSLKESCAKCHETSRWTPSTFDHAAWFVLDRDHNARCNVCHPGNNYQSYTCYGCHEHTESNIIREHREERISNISDCASCHLSSHEYRDGRRFEGDEKGERNRPEGRERRGEGRQKEGREGDD